MKDSYVEHRTHLILLSLLIKLSAKPPPTLWNLAPNPERIPWWLRWWRICLQCTRPGFNQWIGKIPWRREWKPTPVFLPGKSHAQRSQVGYSPWGLKESDMTEWLILNPANRSFMNSGQCLSPVIKHPQRTVHNWGWIPERMLLRETAHGIRIGSTALGRSLQAMNGKFWNETVPLLALTIQILKKNSWTQNIPYIFIFYLYFIFSR